MRTGLLFYFSSSDLLIFYAHLSCHSKYHQPNNNNIPSLRKSQEHFHLHHSLNTPIIHSQSPNHYCRNLPHFSYLLIYDECYYRSPGYWRVLLLILSRCNTPPAFSVCCLAKMTMFSTIFSSLVESFFSSRILPLRDVFSHHAHLQRSA